MGLCKASLGTVGVRTAMASVCAGPKGSKGSRRGFYKVLGVYGSMV